ncbi:MAG TPA: hypothetical protein PKE47_14855, partial [Verrucomicrobiota bacterium]|nr:hypothetical protein [Verrucomicrobiota bacterium]
ASYSDAGQHPPEYAGSVLAEGAVDDVSVWIAHAAGPVLSPARVTGGWQVSWPAWPGWRYRVDSSEDLGHWTPAGEVTAFSPGPLQVDDLRPVAAARSYRVLATHATTQPAAE